MARTDGIGEYVPAGEMLATEQGQQDIVTAINNISGAGVYVTRVDESGAYTYVGKAVVGSSGAGAVWQIKRIDESASPDVVILYAGTGVFNQIWDNRASLSYS